ncbi:hypothetical protein I2F27_11375 [Acinetobacter sp. B5B]|uniref:hypothetical protein n=1 Tax=Acinetobacter baretiae TaxID=2605383 RepID=UPI0018C30448|nr:hypothetical protein [Acinetobacter baretiae]MBF7683920.1 hypothetical protein [Acinetobacter baretiae]
MSKTDVAIVTEQRDGKFMPLPLKAGAGVLQGTFAVIDQAGFAIDSQSIGGANQTCLGIWDNSAQNTGADGDVLALVQRKKQFLMSNSSTDALTQADLGIQVFIEDNQTVAKSDGNGTRSLAGKFMGFDSQFTNYVWVEIE